MVNENVVKDPTVRALLNRREEILEQINKLQIEYSAIGNILQENHNLKNKLNQISKNKEEEEREWEMTNYKKT